MQCSKSATIFPRAPAVSSFSVALARALAKALRQSLTPKAVGHSGPAEPNLSIKSDVLDLKDLDKLSDTQDYNT